MHVLICTLLLTFKVQRRQLGQTLQCRYQRFHTLITDVVNWYHGDININNVTTTINTKLQTTQTCTDSFTIHALIHIVLLTAKVQCRQLGQTLQCRYQRFHTLVTDVIVWFHGNQPKTTSKQPSAQNYNRHTHTHDTCTQSHCYSLLRFSVVNWDKLFSTGTNNFTPSTPMLLSGIMVTST